MLGWRHASFPLDLHWRQAALGTAVVLLRWAGGGGGWGAWLRGNSALGEGRAGKQILVTSSDSRIQPVLMPDPTLQLCTFVSQSSPLAVEAGQSWLFYHRLLKDPSHRGWPIIKQDFESPVGLLPKHRPSCFLLCLLKSLIPPPCCSFLGLHPVRITCHLIVATIHSLYNFLALIFFCLETVSYLPVIH